MRNSPIFGKEYVMDINKKNGKGSLGLVEVERILTSENSESYFVSKVGNKKVIMNESVKSFVIEKLYDIVTTKISKMDVEYQDILKSQGNYKSYKYFKSIDDTVKELMVLVSATPSIPREVVEELSMLRDVHSNLVKHIPQWKESFTYNIGSIKQYYLTVVASLAYSLSFVITSMIDYEQRQGQVQYVFIIKNQNLLEKGLPKNMIEVLRQFNDDIKTNALFNAIKTMKNKKPTAVVKREGASVTTEDIFTGIALGVAIATTIVMLPALIRSVIYFFMLSKVKFAEYIESQAYFLELSTKTYARNGVVDPKVIEKQEKYVKELRDLAAKFSKDKYETEKQVTKEMEIEDKKIVKDADTDTRAVNGSGQGSNPIDIDNSEIIL